MIKYKARIVEKNQLYKSCKYFLLEFSAEFEIKTKKECINGMRPEYAEKLATQYGTFARMRRLDNIDSTGLPNSLIKAVKLFFQNI